MQLGNTYTLYGILKYVPLVLYSCAICSYIFIRIGSSLSGIPFPVSIDYVCNGLRDYLSATLLICLIIDLFLNGVTRSRLVFGITGALFTYMGLSLGADDVLKTAFLFVLAHPKQYSLRCSARCIWVTYYLIIFVTVIACFGGHATDVMTYEHGVMRHSFGFGSPNHLAVLTTIATFAFLYDVSNSWHVCYAPFIIGILLFVFSATNGRMSMVLGLAFLIVVVISRLRVFCSYISSFFKYIAIGILPFLFLLCLVLTMLWSSFPDSFGYESLNSLFNGRPGEMVMFYQQYGFELFGENVTYIPRGQAMVTGESMAILDNAYAHMAIQYGLLFSVAALPLFSLTAKWAAQQRNIALCQYIVFIALFGISEGVILDASLDLAIFAVGAMLANGGKMRFEIKK